MHSFILFFKKSQAFWISLFVIVIFEISLHYIPNLHYYDGTGSFFVYYKREIIENPNKNFDILLLGDSRSLSLLGVKDTPTLYNMSLPAAGPWYYKYLLKKYIKYHGKPRLVVFAADPSTFISTKSGKFNLNPEIWNEFKHRLLNLFTYSETWEQYEGTELFFISKEYLAQSLYSVRYRQVFDWILGARLQNLIQGENTLYKRNKMIEELVNSTNGQINLGDFFFAPEGSSEIEKERWIKHFQQGEINPNAVLQFMDYCRDEKMKVVLLNLPKIEGLQNTYFHKKAKEFYKSLPEIYPNVTYLEFDNMDYPASYFGESIHYSPSGEKVLNKEFIESIYPKLVKVLNNDKK